MRDAASTHARRMPEGRAKKSLVAAALWSASASISSRDLKLNTRSRFGTSASLTFSQNW